MPDYRISDAMQHCFNKSKPEALFVLSSLSLISFLCWSRIKKSSNCSQVTKEDEAKSSALDPPLIRKNSSIKSYTTTIATYPAIRTFYHAHPHAEKLPARGSELPLLVFIHGLGGSLAQFAPLLASLVNIAPCLGIDMPGCGMSGFEPKDYPAYTTTALATLHKIAIEGCCAEKGHRSALLIGHSMGCSISALLISNTAPPEIRLSVDTLGMVAICPKSDPPTRSQATRYRRLFALPDFVLNSLRWMDKRGGTESRSVVRFVGKYAGKDVKKMQLKFNQQFPTPVWRRKALGALPEYESETSGKGGIPGRKTWSGITKPLMLIAGGGDTICTPQEVARIASYLQGHAAPPAEESQHIPPAAEDYNLEKTANQHNDKIATNDREFGVQPQTSEEQSHHSTIVKTVILPFPASHALLYDHATYRTCAGLIEDFLATHISPQLNLGWQLQRLTNSGKWDVKNLRKWQAVAPVSGPIDCGRFRALKTLREQDEEHTPSVFTEKWRNRIFAVIDISHDAPVYDTGALDRGGIQYHKFPTVSKVPPTPTEVADFIALVERLRQDNSEKAVGVHCHYGFNRTGFFIVCYLVEKRGYGVQQAIDEFARERPPGIRHDHFVDTLFVRYCVGLRKVGETVTS